VFDAPMVAHSLRRALIFDLDSRGEPMQPARSKASMLAGGAFLVVADTVARTLLAPQQLPVGVITAMIGVPVFLIQLHQLRRR